MKWMRKCSRNIDIYVGYQCERGRRVTYSCICRQWYSKHCILVFAIPDSVLNPRFIVWPSLMLVGQPSHLRHFWMLKRDLIALLQVAIVFMRVCLIIFSSFTVSQHNATYFVRKPLLFMAWMAWTALLFVLFLVRFLLLIKDQSAISFLKGAFYLKRTPII